MPDQQDWVTKRTADAKAAHPSVTDAVVVLIEKMLNGKLKESPLTDADRKSLARELLKAMMPPQPNEELTK